MDSALLSRLDELMSGTVEPQDAPEFALVKAYTRALVGETLITIFLDMDAEMSYYKEDEYAMFLFGYAIGQKDYLDSIGGLDLSKFKKDDDENLH